MDATSAASRVARLAFAALLLASPLANASTPPDAPSPEQARAIAKEAYQYANPMVDGYRIQHAYFVNTNNPEYKGGWNQIHSGARVYTPQDKAVQTPNSDTPYSMAGLDLRAEPLVLTVPAMEAGRYFSIQLVDLYTHNFAYIGSRTTGNGGGHFLLAGPRWEGEAPKGITQVIRSETELALAIYRTQLLNPSDLENVKAIQAGYKLQPLSAFLGQPAPPQPPAIAFTPPLTPEQIKTSPLVFRDLNFLLQFAPTHPSEVELMQRFASIGIGAGKDFNPDALSPEMKAALEGGIADAWAAMADLKKTRIDTGELASGDFFGTREFLKNNYLYRMAAAVVGIYGNSKQEAMYPLLTVDSQGQALSGSHRYTLRFAPGQLPPVDAFWSVTMYELPASLLVDNPINRYLLNSPMLPNFKRDPDGGITFYLQNESPGADKEANWLPAPQGPFMAVMRLYWPKAGALDGRWTAPQLQRQP
jgi:hypothetical protein